MSNAPTVKIELDRTEPYDPGDIVNASAPVTDADNKTETLETSGKVDGVTVDVSETRTFTDSVTRVWRLNGEVIGSTETVSFPAPGASATLSVDIVDGQGNSADANITVLVNEPAPPVAPMLIGFVSPPRGNSVNPYGWAEHFAAMAPNRCEMVAAYNEPGTTMDPWDSYPTIPAGVQVHLRVKDSPIGTPWFRDRLRTIPAQVPNVLISYHHEYRGGTAGQPGADVSVEDWNNVWRYMRSTVDELGLAGRVLLTPYFMNAWIQEKKQQFEDVWPTGPNGKKICDLIAMSCYSNESLEGYRTPQDLFKIAIDWARRANVRLVIPEWGMQCDSGKPGQTDELRAGVIRETLPYLREQKLADGRPLLYSVTWWSSLSTNTGVGGKRNDFRLLLPGAEKSLYAYNTA